MALAALKGIVIVSKFFGWHFPKERKKSSEKYDYWQQQKNAKKHSDRSVVAAPIFKIVIQKIEFNLFDDLLPIRSSHCWSSQRWASGLTWKKTDETFFKRSSNSSRDDDTFLVYLVVVFVEDQHFVVYNICFWLLIWPLGTFMTTYYRISKY